MPHVQLMEQTNEKLKQPTQQFDPALGRRGEVVAPAEVLTAAQQSLQDPWPGAAGALVHLGTWVPSFLSPKLPTLPNLNLQTQSEPPLKLEQLLLQILAPYSPGQQTPLARSNLDLVMNRPSGLPLASLLQRATAAPEVLLA